MLQSSTLGHCGYVSTRVRVSLASDKVRGPLERRTGCKACLVWKLGRNHEGNLHNSYLFAPVISANSWLSLVSQGGKPIIAEGFEKVLLRGHGRQDMLF